MYIEERRDEVALTLFMWAGLGWSACSMQKNAPSSTISFQKKNARAKQHERYNIIPYLVNQPSNDGL